MNARTSLWLVLLTASGIGAYITATMPPTTVRGPILTTTNMHSAAFCIAIAAVSLAGLADSIRRGELAN